MGRWITHEGRHIYVNSAGQPTTPPEGALSHGPGADATEKAQAASNKAYGASAGATSAEQHAAAAKAHQEAHDAHAAAGRGTAHPGDANRHQQAATAHLNARDKHKRYAEAADDNRKINRITKAHGAPATRRKHNFGDVLTNGDVEMGRRGYVG